MPCSVSSTALPQDPGLDRPPDPPAKARLLVINPHTSSQVSELLRRAVEVVCGEQAVVQVVTARLGAAYISNETSFAIAAHGTLDAWAAALTGQARKADAVLVGCFGDPGLLALRECSDVPVTGLAEASFKQASALGPFSIVTGGKAWDAMLRRVAHDFGHAAHLAGIETVQASGAELAAHPENARALLLQACRDAARIRGVRSIIVGGAGLAGVAGHLQPCMDLPLIDSVRAGAQEALARARSGKRCLDEPVVKARRWLGLSAELNALA